MRLLRMLPWMLAAVSCSSPAAKQTPAAARGVTVFEGARLITGDGSAPIESSAFIIENSKFLRVGKKGALQVPAGATHVDLTGKTVMPAMVDIHSHLGFLKQSDGSMPKANFNRENVFDLDDAKGLVRAGVVGFMHMVRDKDIDEELIALLKQHPGVFFGPNIGITSRGLDAGRPAWLDAPLLHETIPPAQIEKLEQSFTNRKPDVLARTREDWERAKRNIAELRANGVTPALGSDSAGDPSRALGWHAIWEVESLAASGIPPMEVITMSTSTAAGILKLDQLGMVAKGKSSDFIVLDANPLDSMSNIRRISDVYLRGQAVDRAAMRAKWKAEWTKASSN